MRLEEITIQYGGTSAKIAPARGGIVTALQARHTPVLYMDRSTLEDPTKNVRGGIPVLFPAAGKLEGGKFLAAGTEMKQHGFARDLPWNIEHRSESELTMTLDANDATRAVYPHMFHVKHTCLVVNNGIHIEMIVVNRGSEPMPISPGWHPYFACPNGAKSLITGDVPGFEAGRLNENMETGFGLLSPADGRARFSIPELGELKLSFSPELRHLQFWTQPNKDFVCIEPFVGPANTINTPARIDVPPGAGRSFWMRIEI